MRTKTFSLLIAGAATLAAAAPVSSASAKQTTKPGLGLTSLGDWDFVQAKPGRITLQPDPERPDGLAGRFEVRSGDHIAGGERAEVMTSKEKARSVEGAEGWYGWSTKFPADLNPPIGERKKSLFVQWHVTKEAADGCAQPLTFSVRQDAAGKRFVRIRARGGRILFACRRETDVAVDLPVNDHKWHDFVAHVKWSADPAKGMLEAWVDGVQVVAPTRTATLFAGGGAYLKQGYYRERGNQTSVIWHDAMRLGDSYEAVAPVKGAVAGARAKGRRPAR